MLVCSFKHEGKFNFTYSRVRILSDEINNVHIPLVCEHCGEHPCLDACPVEALYLDNKLGIVKVDRDKCIGCGNCVKACPYNGIFIDKNGKAVKCDLCDGDPECVKVCIFPQAMKYVDITYENLISKHESMISKIKLLKGVRYE